MRTEQEHSEYDEPCAQLADREVGLCVPGGSKAGVALGFAAYLWWGFTPIYFKAVARVPVAEIVAHRIIWSWMLLALLLCATGRRSVFMTAIRSRRTSGVLVVTGALLFGSWFGFVWAVANNHVLQISLAYFISPLVKMLLGVVFLRERLRKRQIASVLLAALGVTYLTVQQGQLPLLALGLSLVMNLYIMLRKIASVDGYVGLAFEMTFLLTPALAYALWLWMQGELIFGAAPARLNSLLALSGVITALPLLWVVSAARRLRLVTLGFIQYIMPSIHFLLAVVAYGEPCTQTHLVSFVCIWTALIVYSLAPRRNAQCYARQSA
jgi:chloramphenicol-sensitive protein RarD